MAVTFIPGKSGNYQCLSTDMSGSAPVDDVSWIGANLFCTDTGEWFRVDENLFLVPFAYPISGSISAIVNGSDIQIGAVEIKDADTDVRVKVIQGSSITEDDYAMAVRDAGITSASLVEGGSSVFVENFITDGSAIWVDNIVSASLVAGGSSVWLNNPSETTDGSAVWIDDGNVVVDSVTATVSASLVAGGSTVEVSNLLETFEGHPLTSSPMGLLQTSEPTKLVGAVFCGSTLDTNFWTSGSATEGGAITIADSVATFTTGSVSDGAITLNSHRTARYITGRSNYYRGQINVPTTTDDCNTRWGAFDVNDGYFFDDNGTDFAINYRKSGSDTRVASGAFNGDLGADYVLDANIHTYEIHWTNREVWYFVDDALLHTVEGTTAPLVADPCLKIGFEISNSGSNVNENTINCRSVSINREGQILTQPISYYVSGSSAGEILKHSPGNLHSMLVGSQDDNSTFTLYDGTSTGGTVIYSATYTQSAQANVQPYGVDFKGLPFSDGLFFIISGSDANVTIVYE